MRTTAGETAFTQVGFNLLAPHVKAGTLRLLAGVGKSRFAGMPDIPTVAEAAGLPNFGFDVPSGWVARAGTPKPIIDKLSTLLKNAVQSPEMLERASTMGVDMLPSSPEQFAELIRNDVRKFVDAARVAGVKPD